MVEAIIGYRAWRLKPDDGTVWLQSIYVDMDWPQLEPLHAECRCGRPEVRHTCGIYAWAVPPRGPSYLGYVTGEVALWGDVHFHAHGYRASSARPVSISEHAIGLVPRVAAYQYDLPMVRER